MVLCYTYTTKMYYFLDRVNNNAAYKNLLSNTRDKNFIAAFGVQPNEKPFIAASVNDGFCLYVTSDYVEAQRVLRTIQAVSPARVVYLPSKDDVLLYKSTASKNAIYSRNLALHDVLTGAGVAVACVDALIQPLPPKSTFLDDCFTLQVGVCYDTKMLISKLVKCGYSRVDGISGEGEFVSRGDILDVSMPFGKRYRVDFFDDEIESIREVGEDGNSGANVEQAEVYPLYDTVGLSHAKLDELQRYVTNKLAKKLPANAQGRLSEILSELSIGAAGGSVDNGWLAPFVESGTLQDYLPSDTVVFLDEPKLLKKRVDFLFNEHNERVVNLAKAGEVLPQHANAFCDKSKIFTFNCPTVALQTLPYQSDVISPEAVHSFKTGAVPSYATSDDNLATDIRNWVRTGYEVVIFAGADGVKPTQDKLNGLGIYAIDGETLITHSADALLLPIGIERGFVSHTNKLVVIGTRDLGRGLNQQSLRKTKKQAFLSVEKGDYVVHDVHGIGLCEGIQKITSSSGEVKDYIVVLYKNGDHLYVPVDATNMLSRYSGGENPTLSKLGGEDFNRVKSRVKSGIKAMSIDLLRLYAEREKSRGFRYYVDEYLDEEFCQYFPFKATEDQLRCQAEITKDLTSERIMDRVLVGDVGYGKTEVAMRAAFDVVSNGYQVAVLAPTTILAEQHFKTFSERMSHFDIKVACLNRFRTPDEQRKIVQAVTAGDVDVLIGTHRLLS